MRTKVYDIDSKENNPLMDAEFKTLFSEDMNTLVEYKDENYLITKIQIDYRENCQNIYIKKILDKKTIYRLKKKHIIFNFN